jgi:A/G-specific adenine glycosylase
VTRPPTRRRGNAAAAIDEGKGTDAFAAALLAWFDRHGRKDLPWQQAGDAYRTWLSEIMLQQTQVTTVIGYYDRFLARFPTLQSLAEAPIDDVLSLWAGLGYYARARNLHRCAREVVAQHGGAFPADIDAMQSLPGIGRSTAAAILAFTHGTRHAILDGNVKRVLARYHAIEGSPKSREVENTMWALAEAHTPAERVGDYTQAIMDLGATVCTRTRPRCDICPLRDTCQALATGAVDRYPARGARKSLPLRATQMLLLRNPQGRVLLQQRPSTGIWGGLWSLPEVDVDASASSWCSERGLVVRASTAWPTLRHTFTHFHLDIHPRLIDVEDNPSRVMDDDEWLWYKGGHSRHVGIATPVRKLLARIEIEAAATDTATHGTET